MKTYQAVKIEVVQFEDDFILTSTGNDNIVAGNSSWIGWSEGGNEK